MEKIEESYRRLFPIIRAKCARMLGNGAEADDVAQEAFLRLWRSDLDRSSPEVVSAWVYRTGTRLALSRLRARRSSVEISGAEAPEALAPHLDVAGVMAARATWARLVAACPEKELQAVVLHRLDGLTHREVAEVMHSSDRTVRRWLERFDARARELALEGRKTDD